ncbi:MAG: winged helix-turn-helix domain-containing protein [Bryobacteraceae bacterium]
MAERSLWRDGQAISLTPKALDTLAALLANPGRLVEKDELMKTVWPDAFVEEGNLAVQISLLRKTFGEVAYIETVPRRGYRFVEPVRQATLSPAPLAVAAVEPPPVERTAAPARSRRWILASAGALAGGAAVLSAFRHRANPRHVPVASVAVLPFQVLNAKPDDEGLGLGLTDAVITRLGGLDRFIVRPTSAVREFDKPTRDPQAAGSKLGVEAVLDATLQSAGNKVRLNARLVRAADGQNLWSDTFDLEHADLFTLEDQISNRLAQSLFGQAAPASRYRPDPEAFRLVTLARYYRNRWTSAGQRKAIEVAEQALAIDPKYADAYAIEAGAWSLLGYFLGVPPKEAYPKAEEAAMKALSLDSRQTDAHHAMATTRFFYRWDFAGAEAHLRKALEANPNNDDSLHMFGLLETVRHRNAEGLEWTKKSVAINPGSAWRHVGMTFQYACLERIGDALAESQKAHDLDPALGATLFDQYNLNMVRGDHRAAVEAFCRQVERQKEFAGAMKAAFDKGGIRAFLEARISNYLERAREGAPVSRLVLAQQYTFLGNADEAMRWMEEAAEERQGTVVFVNQHPMYKSLRSHPRFVALVKRIGL